MRFRAKSGCGLEAPDDARAGLAGRADDEDRIALHGLSPWLNSMAKD
jgi:hypothetical protein